MTDTKSVTTDKSAVTFSGWLPFALSVAVGLAGVVLIGYGCLVGPFSYAGWGVLLLVVGITGLCGIYTLQPNQSAVLTFFGKYVGTDNEPGIRFANPFYATTPVSRRTETIEVSRIKVNDRAGNPIEIGAIVVCHISDCAKSTFDVGNVWNFVRSQADSALRSIASEFAYDYEDSSNSEKSDELTLLNGGEALVKRLEEELTERMSRGGIKIEEARISHLAYAPEIASAMLRRQQASAVISARKKIVQGAVDMSDEAIKQLEGKGHKFLDSKKSDLISNLLVVLVGDKEPVPVIKLSDTDTTEDGDVIQTVRRSRR